MRFFLDKNGEMESDKMKNIIKFFKSIFGNSKLDKKNVQK